MGEVERVWGRMRGRHKPEPNMLPVEPHPVEAHQSTQPTPELPCFTGTTALLSPAGDQLCGEAPHASSSHCSCEFAAAAAACMWATSQRLRLHSRAVCGALRVASRRAAPSRRRVTPPSHADASRPVPPLLPDLTPKPQARVVPWSDSPTVGLREEAPGTFVAIRRSHTPHVRPPPPSLKSVPPAFRSAFHSKFLARAHPNTSKCN
eukprot:349862-Chlamydomonas_euryale.AAC.8